MTEFEFIPASDIPARIEADIHAAKRHVLLQAMVLDANREMVPVCSELYAAAKRGANVTVAYDRLNEFEARGAERTALQEFSHKIGQTGVTLALLGKPLPLNPAAGRSHTKLYVMDDVSYFGGGVNLTNSSFQAYDFMLRTKNARIADMLAQLSLNQRQSDDDIRLAVDRDMSFLVDGGSKYRSLILDVATKTVKNADEIWYVSQLSPGKKLERAIGAVSAENRHIWYNSPRSSRGKTKAVAVIDGHISRLQSNYRGTRRIHAKFIVTKRADGTYEAVTGSHNFSDWGVRFGTKEAAIHTTNRELCERLIRFAESLATPE